jgi:hypothetical protein
VVHLSVTIFGWRGRELAADGGWRGEAEMCLAEGAVLSDLVVSWVMLSAWIMCRPDWPTTAKSSALREFCASLFCALFFKLW